MINILLVEDDPDHAILTKTVLEDSKVARKVYITPNGADALDFVYHRGQYNDGNNSAVPDLILLDVELPKVNGFEVLKKLKSDPTYRAIPIVMLTSMSGDEQISRGYAEGANSYVTKPTKYDEFSQKVKSIGLYWGMVNTTQ
jgi:CheY-like chemotaxis protein